MFIFFEIEAEKIMISDVLQKNNRRLIYALFCYLYIQYRLFSKMRLLKTIRLIFTFYRSFLLVSLLITAYCLGLFWQYGFGIFVTLFWLKIATLAITFYFINSYKSKEFYYYQNSLIQYVNNVFNIINKTY